MPPALWFSTTPTGRSSFCSAIPSRSPPLNAADIYPTWLARALPDRIFANAAIAGSGIEEARAILESYWGRTRADIVVLQVPDNDIEALLWTARSPWFMPRPVRAPTGAERALQDSLAAGC